MSIEQALDTVETHVEKVFAALLSGDSYMLQHQSQLLRDAAVVFSGLLHELPDPSQVSQSTRHRIDAIHAALSTQRESLAKLAAITDRQIATIVPAAVSGSSTYGGQLGGRASSSAARIYHSAG